MVVPADGNPVTQRSNLNKRTGCTSPTISTNDASFHSAVLQSSIDSTMSIINITSNYVVGAYNVYTYGHFYGAPGTNIIVDGSVAKYSFYYATNGEDIITTRDNQIIDVPDNITTNTTVNSTTCINQVLASISCVSPACHVENSSIIKIVYEYKGVWKVGFKVTLSTTLDPIKNYTCKVDGNTAHVDFCQSTLRSVSASGTGLGPYNSTVLPINVNGYSHVYYLEDLVRHQTVLDCLNGNCTPTVYRISNTATFFNSSSTKNAVNVHWSASKVFDYFNTVWNRTGMDGSYGPFDIWSVDGTTDLTAHMVNYLVNYTSAVWTPNGIYYGSGDGVNYGPIVSLDAVGHEMMHGIIYSILDGGFDYVGESCAIEESYCDLFGNVVERWINGDSENTWLVGEEYYTPNISGDALRNLSNPRLSPDVYGAGVTYPDSMSMYYNGTADEGGCHINSLIASKAFYLMSEGGIHPDYPTISMSGIGSNQVANIWYSALPLLSAATTFAAVASIHATVARSIFGITSSELLAVETAWALCGVGSLPSPNMTDYINNPGFETVQYPWVTIGTNGVSWLKCCNGYGRGGYALLGQNNSVVNNAIYQIIPAIPSNVQTATLSFLIRSLSNDLSPGSGDTLLVSIMNGTSAALFGNALSYVSDTSVFSSYTLQTFNMMSYIGLGSLRIQFTVNNDAISPPTTWYIDNVYVNVTTY